MDPKLGKGSAKEKSVKKDYWLALFSVASWVAVLLALPRLPKEIPLHWNIGGEIDGWGARFHLIWLGALPFVTWALFTFLAVLDPKRENYQGFAQVFRVLRALLVFLLMTIHWIMVAAAMDNSLDVVFWIKILMGMLFIVLGIVLPRLQPTWFIGIRTPWTLSNPKIWEKTHRLGGCLMGLGGILFLVSAFFASGPRGFLLPIVVLFIGTAVSVAYSALLWHQNQVAGKD